MERKSIRVIHKSQGRGRPATGKDPLVALRLPREMIDAIDERARSASASRSEWIRALIARDLRSAASSRLTPSEIASLRKDAQQASASAPAALAKARAAKAAR